ncbi:DUF1461 domain-containing protein [Arthrobacter sp. zg-Y916]|uniref:DUF1461 domain-containing protein n=1 Tax=Arthrobacter sp. zg-Y916 TaxID=2894190 RepID=UPI001E34FC68|nr:DUF1461 domain-containing protein [Arthrobacter sp. zg-Y916]MCC9194171.1 DUF1461 domain-containing protein [Arthrobacter sp. zg-Y916]
MRDEAVASQDQDPTTERAPLGAPTNGNDAGPSDASETIVSGSHAEGTAERRRAADYVPAEHDAWDAEFAGLTGAESSRGSQDADGRTPAADPAEAPTPAAAPTPAESATPPEAAAPAEEAGRAPTPASTPAPGSDESGQPASPAPAEPVTAAAPAARDEVPGGHPSVAQRSKLPMRAASTMPNLSRYEQASTGEGTADPAEQGSGLPDAEAASGPVRNRPQDTEAEGGPWYGPADGEPVSTGPAAQDQPADVPGISEEEARRRHTERERAAAAKPVLARIIQVAIAAFFPVMLLAAAIRAVATPVFLWVEYHRPGFPADSFGFTTEDRMTYGSYAVDYLLNFSSPRYLGELVTPRGEPLYLATEVSHMADVKAVLMVAFLTAAGMALLSIAGAVYLARRCPGGIRRALFAGAVVTLAVIAALLAAAVVAWEEFFTLVHNIFFSQGNWTFRMDDTLIRLFPSQFWMDAGGTVAAIVLLACILVMVFTWPTKRRRERSRAARDEARQRYLDSLEAL